MYYVVGADWNVRPKQLGPVQVAAAQQIYTSNFCYLDHEVYIKRKMRLRHAKDHMGAHCHSH